MVHAVSVHTQRAKPIVIPYHDLHDAHRRALSMNDAMGFPFAHVQTGKSMADVWERAWKTHKEVFG